jgi:hypothetical protein
MTSTPSRPLALALAVIALLLITASRVPHIRDVEPEADEMNNIYFSLGSPAEIIARTPYDWVPGGFLAMGAWTALVGLHPFVLRWLPLLTFLLGCAFTYRLLLRWRGDGAALLGMLAYGGLGLHIFLSIYTRGYAYPLALLPCALWLTCRYFDHPDWRRALVLALVMVAMFYTQLTSAIAFTILGIYTLLVYRARIWRWWLPAVIALPLALPEILRQREILGSRLSATATIQLPALPQALADLYTNYFGAAALLWAVVLIAALFLALRFAGGRIRTWYLVLWALGAPLAMYALNPLLGFFSGRYSWWIALGIALLVAWGMSWLPRAGRAVAGLALAGLVFAPLPPTGYYMPEAPLLANFRWLADEWRAGDVVVRDPAHNCGAPEEWEIYVRAFFPSGLVFDSVPRDHQRIWYITHDGRETPTLADAVRTGRVAGRFVGPPGCLFRLYEAPPDAEGVLFENGMRFHGMQALDESGRVWYAPLVRREADTLRVRLWWSVDTPPDRDYSVGVYLLSSSGSMIVQSDSAPQIVFPDSAPRETSRWQPGEIYIEERVLVISDGLVMEQGQLGLAVYGWWDAVRLHAPGVSETGLLRLADVAIAAW